MQPTKKFKHLSPSYRFKCLAFIIPTTFFKFFTFHYVIHDTEEGKVRNKTLSFLVMFNDFNFNEANMFLMRKRRDRSKKKNIFYALMRMTNLVLDK